MKTALTFSAFWLMIAGLSRFVSLIVSRMDAMSERLLISIVSKLPRLFAIAFVLCLSVGVVQAKEQPRSSKNLGEQVQDIKSEVLAIAEELNKLEERLLYPSHSQIALYVSLRKNQTFRPDSVSIEMDGKSVASHLYTDREVEALNMGGVHRIYTGNIALGTHQVQVTMRGKSDAGSEIRVVRSFPVDKDPEPAMAELLLSEGSITLINR